MSAFLSVNRATGLRAVVLVLVVVLWLPAAWPEQGQAIITFDAAAVVYDMDGQIADLQGNVRVYIQLPGEEQRRVVVRAKSAKVDLTEYSIGASEGVRVATEEGVLEGEAFQYNGQTDEFRLTKARSVLEFGAVAGEPQAARGYLTGKEIGQRNDVVYVIHGRITTCNRANPHYVLLADKLRYNPKAYKLEVWNGRLRIHGVTIPGYPGRMAFGLGPATYERPELAHIPRYSSRDHLYVPYSYWLLGDLDTELRSRMKVRVSQELGLRGWSTTTYQPDDKWQWDLVVSRMEDMYDDLGDVVLVDRQPELRVTRHLLPEADREQKLDAILSLGRFTEDLWEQGKPRPHRPDVTDERAMAELRFERHPQQRRLGIGHWYGTSLRGMQYGEGGDYHDLSLWVGLGGQLSGSVSGSATLTHHFTGDDTPFLFDEVDVETELQPALDVQLNRRWSLAAEARYDLDESNIRHYDITLSRRSHCLTWRLVYHKVGHSIGLVVDINGLTGGTSPPRGKAPVDELLDSMQADMEAGPRPTEP